MIETKIDNRETSARDFFYYKRLEVSVCFGCDTSQLPLYILKNGFDSVICEVCLNDTLRFLNCKNDFYCNDFNKKTMSDKYIDKYNWK